MTALTVQQAAENPSIQKETDKMSTRSVSQVSDEARSQVSTQPIGNTAQMRTFLIAQMEGVAQGTIEPAAAKAVTNIAQQIHNTKLLELKAAKLEAEIGPDRIKSVALDE